MRKGLSRAGAMVSESEGNGKDYGKFVCWTPSPGD